MKRTTIVIIYLIICLPLVSQNVTVEAKVDSSVIYIGDQVGYNIKIRQPEGMKLTMPVYKDTLHNSIEILSQTETDTVYEKSGDMVLTKRYLITSFDTGFYQIPPYYLEYETPQGKKRFYSDYVPLKVKRVDITPPDTTDVIFDIKGPEKVGYSAGEIIPWILLAFVVIGVSWLAYKYLPRRKSKADESGPVIPDEPIHIITFRELDKLEKKGLWQAGRVKEYYTELTEILRYYIEIRYRANALEMTSEEILNALRTIGVENNEVERMRAILQNADLSKFARYQHDAPTNKAAMEDAREFVRSTYRRAEENGESGKEVSDDE